MQIKFEINSKFLCDFEVFSVDKIVSVEIGITALD
jgi:hypothetical protein